MEDLAGRQFGVYRLVESIAEGGMATIYKAHQPSVDRYVALKVLAPHFATDAQFIARFRHEARIVAHLQHPRILSVLDFGEADGRAFLAMPFVHGGTLADLIARGPIHFEVALRVTTQVCEALDYAHSKGVIHRDVKPSNVLLDERGNCLVADFGIARPAVGMTRLTTTGTLMGTPAYMSPEQAEGVEVGPPSDLYSFGIVLYEMLTGRVPFHADTPVALALKHLNAPIPPPRSINPALSSEIETVLHKALARSTSDRFTSGESLADALRRAMESNTTAHVVSLPDSEELDRPTLVLSRNDAQPNQAHKAPETLQSGEESTVPVGQKRHLAFLSVAAAVVLLGLGWAVFFRTSPNELGGVVPASPILGKPALTRPPEPLLTSRVNDDAHVLTAIQAAVIDQKIRDIQSNTGNVVVVATVQALPPSKDITQYSMLLFDNNGHGIGEKNKDNGVLVLLALSEQQVRITTGFGVESIVTNQIAEQIVKDMLPNLRSGDFGAALLLAVTRLDATITAPRSK